MKKLTLAIIMVLSSFSIASAELGIKIGVSAQMGDFDVKGSEKNKTTSAIETKKQSSLFANGTGFIEKDLKFLPIPILNRLSIGYDNMVHDLHLGSAANARQNTLGAGGATVIATTHKLSADVTKMETLYATFNILPWLYVKAGTMEVDLKTKFTGSTTSTYKTNHSLDGEVFGVGAEYLMDSGLFIRAEYNDYEIDGKTVTNTGTDSVFEATLADVSGQTAKFSIGKAF